MRVDDGRQERVGLTLEATSQKVGRQVVNEVCGSTFEMTFGGETTCMKRLYIQDYAEAMINPKEVSGGNECSARGGHHIRPPIDTPGVTDDAGESELGGRSRSCCLSLSFLTKLSMPLVKLNFRLARFRGVELLLDTVALRVAVESRRRSSSSPDTSTVRERGMGERSSLGKGGKAGVDSSTRAKEP